MPGFLRSRSREKTKVRTGPSWRKKTKQILPWYLFVFCITVCFLGTRLWTPQVYGILRVADSNGVFFVMFVPNIRVM
jgi:hypothetical protein